MVAATKVNGFKTIWRVLASIFGTMEEYIKVSTRMTKSMVTVCIHGLMVVVMKGIGIEGSSMAWVLIWYQKTKKRSLGYGRMVSV
jgi:hypothetical protein